MEPAPLVIAVDGPAGAGKSTVTRTVAEHLGILFLDSGAMYRAATVGAMDAGVDLEDPDAVAAYVRGRKITFTPTGVVQLDGVALGERIRTPAVTARVKHVADNPACREHLVAQQQAILGRRDAAVEGRDATTVICPDAQLKIYLDASPVERARRRVAQWESAGLDHQSLAEVAAAIERRDAEDMARPVGGLRRAEDAVHLITDGMSPAAVIATIIAHAVTRRPLLLEQRVAAHLIVGRSREPGYVRVAEGCAGGAPGPWKLGLTNPGPERLPTGTVDLARNQGGRQAGVLLQGKAVICLAGDAAEPDRLLALPMLPQSWYVIEPGVWHAVVQIRGTICAWAEGSEIREDRHALDPSTQEVLAAWLRVYLPDEMAGR